MISPATTPPPDTEMLHILYDGSGWTSISAAADMRKNKKPQNDEDVGWHEHLYVALSIQIRRQLQWARTNDVRERPYGLVLTFLTRTVAPLKKLMSFLFSAEEVDVCTVDSARGAHGTDRPLPEAPAHMRCCLMGSAPRAAKRCKSGVCCVQPCPIPADSVARKAR